MDYQVPIESLIPGVRGKVLAVLAKTDAELSMRTVGRLANVSTGKAIDALNRLVKLGIVQRRPAGRTALVRLSGQNEVARIIKALGRLSSLVVERIKADALQITPRPAALVIFGSFARGQANEDSDIDVLAVRPSHLAGDDLEWTDTLGRWSDLATEIIGNPVNLIEVSENEIATLLRSDEALWREILRDGETILGSDLRTLGTAA